MLLIKSIVLIVMCFFTSISGGNIVEELRQRFNYVTDECVDAQNKTHPVFKCSGLLIRGVYMQTGMKFAWSLKTSDKKKNSFSFSYLRRDHTYKYAYDAGFILYPHSNTPPNKSQQEVLCSFADNAITDAREDRGCGRFELDETTGSSEPCRTQNITTASQYIEHCNATNWSSHFYCGFKMTEETGAKDFVVVLEANALLQNASRAHWSEHRVEGWDDDNAKSIPIQAFYYIIGAEKGYESAVKFRDDFYAQSGGETVPIVGIKLPTSKNPNVEITGDVASS